MLTNEQVVAVMMALMVAVMVAMGVGYIVHLRNERDRAREALHNALCRQAYMAGLAMAS
jgi:hypothetical protein